MFTNFFITTIRNGWKNKSYTFLNIFGLGLGIACAALIFFWVKDELTFDNVHKKKARLYQVNVNWKFDGNMITMGSTPRPMADALQKEIPGIINTARLSDRDQQYLIRVDDRSMYASGKLADPSVFSMFTFTFVQGNAENAFKQLYSMVITESAAEKFFGHQQNVIGKTIRVNNTQDFVVTAVVKNPPQNSFLQFEWLAPYAINLQTEDAIDWGSFGPFTYVELDESANPTAINKQLKDFISHRSSGKGKQAFLFPMSDWHLYGEFVNGKQTGGGQIKQVRMLSIIGWIILLIACINFMNLVTATSQKRAKEVGVRKMLGAGKERLVIQFMGEALLLSAISALVAIAMVTISLPAFNVLMQKNLVADWSDPINAGALVAITVICGLVAGSYPAFYLSSFKPLLVLKGLRLKTGGAALLRKGLVVLQFTVAVVFICSTAIVYLQVQHVKGRELGLNRYNLLEIDLQHDTTNIFPLMKQDLLRSGVVENVATSDHVTLNGGNTDSRFRWSGKSQNSEVSIAFRSVSPEFVSTVGMQVVDGRDFKMDGSPEKSNVIINRSLAKLMGSESVVGKIIQSPRGNEEGVYSNMTVVGVVEDFVYGNVYGQPGPLLFFCQPPQDANLLYVRTRPGSKAGQALAKMEEVIKKYNPEYPFQYRFVDDQFNRMFVNEMQVSKISGIFAVLAIVISCLGLFGLATYTAEQRIKEIGIRKVLGATVTGIATLLSGDFLRLVIISCVVALPVAWWIMHDWLQNFEYRMKMSSWIFIASVALAIFIALVTISFQALRAALTNPAKSLRTE